MFPSEMFINVITENVSEDDEIIFSRQYDIVAIVPQQFKGKKLFHISKAKLDKLEARKPNNFFCKTGDEECTTKRISMSTDIDHCIAALGDAVVESEYNVYEPSSYNNLKIVPNDIIVKHKLVSDAHLTNEIWILNPTVKVRYIGKIKVIDNNGKYKDTYFNVNGERIKEKLYFFNWEWVDKNVSK